jgi:hypothetical protein
MMIHGADGGFDQGLLFAHDLHRAGILAARMPVIHGLRGQRIAPHVYAGHASGGLLTNMVEFA